MAFGSFDFLHKGHLFYFQESKKLGDKLIVVVARDKTIEKVKGKKPQFTEKERLKAVSEVRSVDMAVLGDEIDQFKVLEEFNPDVISLGYDQKSFITDKLDEEILKRGLKIKVVRVKPFEEQRFKSSKMKNNNL